jgi:hypothetical protein
MLQYRTNRGTVGPARHVARGLLALLALCLPCQAARADVALYQAVVPLRGTTEADRAAGFSEALRIAAVRATGRRDAADNARITAAAADPSRYIQQYSTTPDRMLKVGFDGRELEQLLQQAGLPLWPAERPTTTVYLFVASVAGGARAVVAAEHPPERAAIENNAQARGVPLAWPTEPVDAGNARGRATAGATGAAAAVLAVFPVGEGSFDWSFAHAGQVANERGSAARGVDMAADTLAARYAPASTRGFATIDVRVGGLQDVGAYASLTSYLQGLSLVRSVAPEEFSDDVVRLRMTLRGDLELLRRIAALDARLVSAPRSSQPVVDAPDFVWRP